MAALDPERWVEEHGDALLRYARARTGDAAVAEDLVQDTFLAAWKARDRFQGASADRTWLTGILRHKILDHHRARARAPLPLDEAGDSPDFRADGHWDNRAGRAPAAWARVDDALARDEFHAVLAACLGKLPERTAAAFRLRELEDVGSEEICKVLDLSPTHFWVTLHRARTQLRRCLETNWFKP